SKLKSFKEKLKQLNEQHEEIESSIIELIASKDELQALRFRSHCSRFFEEGKKGRAEEERG
ncbi:unnamed protein product, partial [Ilex paraguariensis]